jgi:hypothetical protein
LLAITESIGKGEQDLGYSPDGRLVAAGPFVGTAELATPHSLRPLRSGRGGGDRRRAHRACRRSGRLLSSGPRERRAPARRERGRVSLPHPHSRNLDAARAGDLDGDGSWEPLLPDSSYTALEAVRRTKGGVETAWRLPLGDTLATNLASATDSEGRVALAAGTAEGKLRIWR